LWCEGADRALPKMPVRVDETRNDETSFAVDHFGGGAPGQIPAADGNDFAVPDQNIGIFQISELAIDRDNKAALE
jgi:hypothetical protein